MEEASDRKSEQSVDSRKKLIEELSDLTNGYITLPIDLGPVELDSLIQIKQYLSVRD